MNGHLVRVGTEKGVAPAVEEYLTRLRQEGKTAVIVSIDGQAVGLIATEDRVRPNLVSAFDELRNLGIKHITMVTGDSKHAAAHLANTLRIEFVAEALPSDKLDLIHSLQQQGRRVGMIGDGINDAPALAAADVGIAMGAAGTAAALEAADIALMTDDWNHVPAAVKLSRRTFRAIQQNLFLAGLYNFVGIALAWFGLLPPIVAAAMQSFPGVAILLNSSRLLRSET